MHLVDTESSPEAERKPEGCHQAFMWWTSLLSGAKVIIALLVPSLYKHYPSYLSPNSISGGHSFIMGIFSVSATLSSDITSYHISIAIFLPLKTRMNVQACSHHSLLAGVERVLCLTAPIGTSPVVEAACLNQDSKFYFIMGSKGMKL